MGNEAEKRAARSILAYAKKGEQTKADGAKREKERQKDMMKNGGTEREHRDTGNLTKSREIGDLKD